MINDSAASNCGCNRLDDCPRMMPVEDAEALSRSLGERVQETELVPLREAAGRTLARDLSAPRGMPFFDGAAMDGYAVRLGDFEGEGPWQLPITAEVAAGSAGEVCGLPGAARIFTGAPVPGGYDAVVMQEDCALKNGFVEFYRPPAPGENIRRAGSDLKRGTVLVSAGTRIEARHTGLLAASGYSAVNVYRRPRVALLSTGDELAEAGQKLAGGAVYDANRPMLQAMLEEAGAAVTDAGVLPDEPQQTTARFAELAGKYDAVISTGGASVGDHDHIKSSFERAGGALLQWRVAMKPGKPATFGRLGGMAFVGLPGNPYAAYIGCSLFAVPLVRTMSGLAPRAFAPGRAVAGFSMRKKAGRAEFVAVRLAGYDNSGLQVVEAQRNTSSATLFPLASADGIAVIPAETTKVAPGDRLALRHFC
ncbi:gephyrin-like molybdotransferase Glp [Nisaea sp.]|uniref:molybdopterin molybdotransferase MoeA n=1 Tax=Nisaea sp. TaxID=2024842 RepID=UPI003B52CEEA